MSEKHAPQQTTSPETIDVLIEVLEEISAGIYSDRIMPYTSPDNPPNVQRIAEAVGMMMVRIEARELHLQNLVEELREANAALQRNTLLTVESIARALGTRDEYTEGHAERVAAYSVRLGTRVGLELDQVRNLHHAGLLHDIGKIGFSDKVFNNTGRPDAEILAEIHQHPLRTREILKDLAFLGPVLDFAVAHHEKLDGTGYPNGLKADEIPYEAKILAVADCFDAITTTRSYQSAKSVDEALAILEKLSGSHLDPELVQEFSMDIRENGMEKGAA